jgi:hypothetical protein
VKDHHRSDWDMQDHRSDRPEKLEGHHQR